MPVTTRNAFKEETPFISSDKKALYLPTDMPAFQLDFTQYYYPNSVNSPGENDNSLSLFPCFSLCLLIITYL